MGRSPCCEKVRLKKGPWTPDEDKKLMAYIEEFGHGSWRALPAKAGLQRCGKSCRLRWTNYLRPDIKRGKFSLQEEQTIIQLHALLGNRWSAIAAQLPRRTDNEIKNYWNTHLKKRLSRMGIDPTTHKPKTDSLGGGAGGSSSQSQVDAANLSHMAQWESARLEAEARLVRESSKLQLQKQLGSTVHPARLVLNKITPRSHHPSLPPCLDVLKAWQSSWSSSSSKLPSSTTTKDNNKMHSMYAMMLSTDESLESPTSTLSFPGSHQLLPLPPVPTNNNNVNVGPFINESLLPLTNNNNNTECSNNEAWRHFNNLIAKHSNNNNTEAVDEPNLQQQQQEEDDDIMAAVEAFRSSGFDDNIPQLSNNVLQAALESCEENLDGSIGCNVNQLEEDSKHYWNSILGLVNDSLSGSSVF